MSKLVISTSSFDVNNNRPLQHLIKEGIYIVQNSYGRKLTETETAALLGSDTVGMIAGIEPLTEHVLASAKELKVVSRCGSGLDNVDLAAAKRYGITVLNTPEAPAQAVAELTLGLILTALRQICQTDRLLREGQWPRTQGRLLAAQQVGIIGLGRVGRRVAHLCQAFGAEVVAHDSYVEQSPQGVKLVSLEELLVKADIVSLHLTYDAHTHHLLNKEAFARMKRGAVVINTARGGLIDETSLAEALLSGQLDAAALDVFEQEPYRGPLLQCDKAILTSHVGSLAKEARQRMELEAAENLLQGLIKAGVVTDEHATNV
ncbi:phosphoglycerate dehydrogenase [Nitrosovibrio tenuis]|uniref:D-3-phosphoglycerate dehydrogenase n=1 Tax=Nitrosovibrio tenuis TaxID=1233 RepID=A0A1H7PHK2_9PROT|nr:phosphoglycerate dehydrogenase [Nitrosovibrio tenuis]SEL35262.1 D-3-phosphoglycerate dehydrogenase [Nitrosovibrio tenuis]